MLYLILFIVLAVGSGAVFAALPSREFNIDVMLEALRQVENWNGHARGSAGERGPWQITPAVWSHLSDKPFSWADGRSNSERSEQRRVAREYVVWIHRRLTEARMDCTPYTVALVWGAGWSAYFYDNPHRPSRAKKDYAKRAQNLYEDLYRSEQYAQEIPIH